MLSTTMAIPRPTPIQAVASPYFFVCRLRYYATAKPTPEKAQTPELM